MTIVYVTKAGAQRSSQNNIFSSSNVATTDYAHDDGAKVNEVYDERNSKDMKLVVADYSAAHCPRLILRCERRQSLDAYCRKHLPSCQRQHNTRQPPRKALFSKIESQRKTGKSQATRELRRIIPKLRR